MNGEEEDAGAEETDDEKDDEAAHVVGLSGRGMPASTQPRIASAAVGDVRFGLLISTTEGDEREEKDEDDDKEEDESDEDENDEADEDEDELRKATHRNEHEGA